MQLRKKNKLKGRFKVEDNKFIDLNFDSLEKTMTYVLNTFPQFRYGNIKNKLTGLIEYSVIKNNGGYLKTYSYAGTVANF